MTTLYTLPTCPICEMVKKKLFAKEIPFVERSFEELPTDIKTDRAPVLAIDVMDNPSGTIYLFRPIEINKWIEEV